MLKRKRARWKSCRVAKMCNLQISQPAKFRRLRFFADYEISQHCSPTPTVDCFLTRLFVVLYKFALDVILVHLCIFVISLY